MLIDVNGQEIGIGDMVATLNGDLKGRVCDKRTEDGDGFVCVRASHRPYSKGIWYSSEHVQRLTKAKVVVKVKEQPRLAAKTISG